MPEDTAVEYWWRNRNFPRDKAIVPGTDEVIHRGSAEQCYEAWSARCAQLGLTFDNEWATYGNCCCLALPTSLRDEACAKISDATPEVLRRKYLNSASTVMRFLATVVSWWKSDEVVTQEKADARGAVCAKCPHNLAPIGTECGKCNGNAAAIATKIFQFIGKRKTASDHLLDTCSLCSCSLKLMCWTPHDALMKNQDGVPPAPSWCWKATEKS
jgi:hypothetical protein